MANLGIRSAACVLVPALLVSTALAQRSGTHTYGIEIDGVLCGYSRVHVSTTRAKGKPRTVLKQKMFTMLSALGFDFNTELDLTYHLDPATGGFTYHDSRLRQGKTDAGSTVFIKGDKARFTSPQLAEATTVGLPPGAILPNPVFFPYLRRDFEDLGLETKAYDVLDVRVSAVQRLEYTKVDVEDLEVSGTKRRSVVLDEKNQVTGVRNRLWLDATSGQLLEVRRPGKTRIYLADASVMRKIEKGNLDATLLTKTNVRIADVPAISFLKVQAVLEPTGLRPTSASLNVPGQRFDGTVTDNLIEGVFEIAHPRYDGAKAPAFPPPDWRDESLRPYLGAEDLIEAHDPTLVEAARGITKGSKDSWQAACRLSKWVGENIHGAIPGGTGARNTYDLRSGECAAHSFLLAAFCRSVGIPARAVWGCMYLPRGGSAFFGQHVWNEVYMGEAGWVPVDATIFEADFVDSGHVRIGVFKSRATALNARTMEILDHRTSAKAPSGKGVDGYAAFVGRYSGPAGRVLELGVQDGRPVVHVGRKQLPLKDPNAHGAWYCTLTPFLYFMFSKDAAGQVVEMQIHEIRRLPRVSDPEKMEPAVPERLRGCLGGYRFAALRAEFTVRYRKEGQLALEDPVRKKIVPLQPEDDAGSWRDESGTHRVSFESNDGGTSSRWSSEWSIAAVVSRRENRLFITLSPRSPDPLYKQVTDQIRDAIATGELPPNEKLPSIRELARALDISLITVKRAYQDLETMGYILTRQGLGCFVAPVDKGRLRTEKLNELGTDLSRIQLAAKKYGITKEDLIRLIQEMEED